MTALHSLDFRGSHAGEDQWIVSHFGPDYHGYAVELGALDGVYLSNTLLLEERGWDCLCIEPNPVHHEALMRNRKRVMFRACDAHPMENLHMLLWHPSTYGQTYSGLEGQGGITGSPVGLVRVTTVDACLKEANFPRLDVLSIDVDGIDFSVLQGANVDFWRPSVIIMETQRSPDQIPAYLTCRGYKEAAVLGENTIYTASEP